MANDPKLKMSMQDASGNYYRATLNRDNTYTITTDAGLIYLDTLPKGWENIDIVWERNLAYWGVFRSQSQNFELVKQARAIALYLLFGNGGVNAYCTMTIYIFNEDTFGYDVFYRSQLDLSGATDDKVTKTLTCSTLDSELYELLKSRFNASFNLRFWTYDSGEETWSTDGEFVYHDGIKLLWENNWISSATPDNVIVPNPTGAGGTFPGTLLGFNHGNTGDACYEWIPSMVTYSIVQNNGTTTFIGNDILQPFFPIYSQGEYFTSAFSGSDDIKAWTTGQGLLKNLLPSDTGTVDVKIQTTAQFFGDIIVGGAALTSKFFAVVLFEIGQDNEPTIVSGEYQYTELCRYDIGSATGTITPIDDGLFTDTVSVTLNFEKVYVLGCIYDDDVTPIGSGSETLQLALQQLKIKIYSDSTSGVSGATVDAPRFPVSNIISFTPAQVWQKLMDVIDSTETDAYGFPVSSGSSYVGASTFLSSTLLDPADYADLLPSDIRYTSENAIRDINGNPYMTISPSDFFSTWNKLAMCGLGIEGDDTMRIEQLGYFFSDTEILELDTVANFKITPLSEILANKINAGYPEINTNKNFGVDAFSQPAEYALPLNKTPKDKDWQVTEVQTDIYFIEKARAQNTSESSTPSSANSNVLLQVDTSGDGEAVFVEDPGGNVEEYEAVRLKRYSGVQSDDDTSPPYLYGMYYPDTAYNLAFTPASNMYRNGALINSMCDSISSPVATFRRVYQQQYNDPTAPPISQPGISKRLDTSYTITEVADIDVTTLNAKLFRPYILQIEVAYPVNMYSLINANPRGYIKFTWQGVEYKGFIYRLTQSAGNNKNNIFELLAHPDTTDEQLRLS